MYKRETRKGCPEVILALDKQYNDLHEIALKTLEKTGLALISKVPEDVYTKLSAQLRLERYMVETAARVGQPFWYRPENSNSTRLFLRLGSFVPGHRIYLSLKKRE